VLWFGRLKEKPSVALLDLQIGFNLA
jgi:hypothetical protein